MSGCSQLMQMSAAGPLVESDEAPPAPPRQPFDGVVERAGRSLHVRFSPHCEASAPTVFLLPRGGGRLEDFSEQFVRALEASHSVVRFEATGTARCAPQRFADEAAEDLYAVYDRFSGNSTNRTLTSVNVLVAIGTASSLAIRLSSRFTRNNVDAVILVEPVFAAPNACMVRVARCLASLAPSLAPSADVLDFDASAGRLWPAPDAWRSMYLPTLVVAQHDHVTKDPLAHLVDAKRAQLSFAAAPHAAARLVVDHAARVVAYYDALRERASAGFVIEKNAAEADIAKFNHELYSGAPNLSA